MTDAKDGNRSRERMKQEIVYLRETLAALETQLTQMRAPPPETRNDCVAVTATERAQQIADAAWQDIAERQRRLRYEAEVENNRLRGFLEDQIRLGKTLEKLLHRRQLTEVESMLARRLDGPFDPNSESESLLDSATVLHDLHAGLREQLAQARDVFMNECFTREVEDATFRHIDLRYRDEVGTYVETSERRVVPFDERVVSDALLRQFEALNPHVVAVQDLWARDGIHAVDLTTMIDTVRFRGVSRTKLLMQRVVQADCTILVYAGLTDPGESLGTPCDGLLVRHRGWSRLRALADPGAPQCVTEYLNYHVATPEVRAVIPDQKRKIGTLTNYVLATIGFQMDVGKETIDNYLLAHAKGPAATDAFSLSRDAPPLLGGQALSWQPQQPA